MEMLNPDGSAPEPRQSGFERLANRGSEPLVDRARLDRAPSLPVAHRASLQANELNVE
jgi:hypothetical protein